MTGSEKYIFGAEGREDWEKQAREVLNETNFNELGIGFVDSGADSKDLAGLILQMGAVTDVECSKVQLVPASPKRLIFIQDAPPSDGWKANLLYIRMLRAYGLADTIPASRLERYLRHLAAKAHDTGVKREESDHLAEDYKHLAADIHRLMEVFNHDVEDHYPGSRSRYGYGHDKKQEFLKDLAAIYQLGRREDPEAESTVSNTVSWLAGFPGSYRLKSQIDRLIRNISCIDGSVSPDGLLELMSKLHAYEIMRDLGRCLATAAPAFPRMMQEQQNRLTQSGHSSQPGVSNALVDRRTALIIDEDLFVNPSNPDGAAIERGQAHKNRLCNVAKILRNEFSFYYATRLDLDHLNKLAIERQPPSVSCLQLKYEEDVRLTPEYNSNNGARSYSRDSPLVVSVKKLSSQVESKRPERLQDFGVLILDVEYGKRFYGPSIVQWLAQAFDQLRRNKLQYPRIVVFSKSEHVGYIHQCLNLGAESYVLKNRIYSLPARIARADLSHSKNEPRGSKANFHLLYHLLPDDITELNSTEQQHLVNGSADRAWIKMLPKTDLHTHIGTCIRPETITAMALNTCGYLIKRDKESFSPAVQAIAEKICRVVAPDGQLSLSPER